MPNEKADQNDVTFEDGTEGSTVGYIKAGQTESPKSDEYPDSPEGDDEGGEFLDDHEDDEFEEEEDSDDEGEEPDESKVDGEALQKMYLTKFRELSKQREKVELMDEIQKNPEKMIPWLAEKLGVEIGAPSKENEGGDDFKIEPPDMSNLQPKQNEDMLDFMNRALATGFQQMMSQLPKAVQTAVSKSLPKQRTEKEPLFSQDQQESGAQKTQKAIEALDKTHEDWPLFEDDMIAALREDPTLIDDPEKLYKAGRKRSGLFGKRKQSKSSRERKRFSSGVRGGGLRKGSRGGRKVVSFNDAWDQALKDTRKRNR